MTFVVLIGASGSGKTTIARTIEQRCTSGVPVFFFDQVGVPSPATMVAGHGTGENWQRATTLQWIRQLAPLIHAEKPVLFEGQTRLAFLAEGIREIGNPAYWPILVDCDDPTRISRLTRDRQQPDLASAEMMDWAAFLRDEAHRLACEILDTTSLTLGQSVQHVLKRLGCAG